jgi:Ran GTPase-activating protein (RanGAP) involved in mRNA processing and transport
MQLIYPHFRVYVVMCVYITWKEKRWEKISVITYYNFKKDHVKKTSVLAINNNFEKLKIFFNYYLMRDAIFKVP